MSTKYNHAIIDGNGNLMLQDIDNSTITINQINDDVKAFVQHFLAKSKEQKRLNIIVLASTKESFEKIDDFKALNIEPFFGEQPHNWKPFKGKESIFELLKEYRDLSGFKLDVQFIELGTEITNNFKTYLKEIRPRTILIVDVFSLNSNLNKFVAEIFNERGIGACLIPVCQSHTLDCQLDMVNIQKDVFYTLNDLFHGTFKKALLQVELNIPSKEDLFRRLTNIAIKHLKLKPQRATRFPPINELKQQHSDIQQ